MKLRVFTFVYDRCAEQFDDTALRRFFESGAEAIDVREHFFECDGRPIWTLLVSYRNTSDTAPMTTRNDHSRSENPKQELSIDEVMRFDAIRAWRNTRASRDGKPPYVLLTNRQIAMIA